MLKLLILNGPNMNLLGLREPELYGRTTYGALCERIRAHAAAHGMQAELYQSNHEGDLVDQIQAARGVYDGIVINPAAYTHTSEAILDALVAVGIPAVEVHITDPAKREAFRSVSYVRAACAAAICGHGIDGYLEAMDLLAQMNYHQTNSSEVRK